MKDKFKALISNIKMLDHQFDNPIWFLGLSGGVDSVVLFYALLAAIEKTRIHVLHVNHNYRGEASDGDEVFVRKLCAQYEVKLSVKQIDMKGYALSQKVSLEMSGREQRYAYFRQEMGEDGLLALAHHRDDQVETVLMRILRGTGLHGLKGMTMIDRRRVRPLLDWTKDELYQLATERNWVYREDHTNYVPDVLRNKIRLELLPLLKNEYQSGVEEAFLRLSHIAEVNDRYWQEYKTEFIAAHVVKKPNYLYFEREYFSSLLEMAQSEVIRASYEFLQGHIMDLGFDHVQIMLQEINHFEKAVNIDIPGGIGVYVNSKRIYFYKKNKFKDTEKEVSLNESSMTPWGRFTFEFRAPTELDGSHHKQVFDLDKLSDLKLRTRKAGDYFYPWAMEGKKKIKDFFIDEKIPPFLRNHIPLLISGEDIVWVVGWRPDRRFLYDGVEGRPVIITFEEENHGL